MTTGNKITFKVESNTFIDAAKWALKGFDHNKDTEYILFEVDAKNSILNVSNVASDYYFSKKDIVITDVEFDNDDSSVMKFAIDGRFLSKSLSTLPKNTVLKVKQKAQKNQELFEISNGSMRISVPLFEKKKFPKKPDITELGEISGYDLSTAIKSLTKVSDIAGASARPAIGALDYTLKPDEKKMTVMGTDAYVISEFTLDYDPSDDIDNSEFSDIVDKNDNIHFLIHADDSNLVGKEGFGNDEVVKIGVDSSGRIAFVFDNGRVACMNRVDTNFINYQAFLNVERDEKKVTVELSELEKAVKDCKTLSWESDDIIIKITNDNLLVTNRENNITRKIEIADHEQNDDIDDELKVMFSHSVISKAFHSAHTDKVQLVWEDFDRFDRSFFLLKPILDSGDVQGNVFILFTPIIK